MTKDIEQEFIDAWNAGKVRRVSDGAKPWVGLTGVEIRAAWHRAAERYNNLMSHEFYKEIETLLKEKNT